MLKVLDVDGAVRRVSGGWTATGQQWAYDAERYARVSAERKREQQAMLGYLATRDCRMEYLRRELDDPDAAPCGRCDNCTGRAWPTGLPEQAQSAARDHLLRPGVEIAPRKMWPTGMKELDVDVSGKIDPGLAAETGRALGRLTDLGWGPRLRDLLAVAASEAAVPDDVLGGVVKVLADWDWAQRPAAVTSMPSRSHPDLVTGLARRIADIGQIPYLGALDYAVGDSREAGDPDGQRQEDSLGQQNGAGQQNSARQQNSAQRLHAVWDAFSVPASVRDGIARTRGPVLLVDDRIDSGWSLTVAAMLLRQAGAAGVLPFVLAATAG
jgi:ATP-dependent DNA helicase RecQ